MSGLSRLSGRGAAALASLAFTLALAFCAPGEARAQWAPSPSNGDHIYNTNAGGVGVGTNSPGNYRLHVFGVGSSVEAMVANFFGTHNNLLESQSGVKVGLLNNYYSLSDAAETARGVVTLGYGHGKRSDLTGYYSRQRVWHDDAAAQGVYAIAEADSFGSAGQRLYGGRFKAKTTDVTGGAGNYAIGAYAWGEAGASTSQYHAAFGVLAQASAAAGTHATVSTYALYAEGKNSGAGRAYGVYSAAGTNYFNGSVGVGTASPSYLLDVQGGQVNASGGLCIAGDCKSSWSQVAGGGQWAASGTSIYYNTGSVGVGTTSPTSVGTNYGTLDIRGGAGGGIRFGTAGGGHGILYAGSTDGATLETNTTIPIKFNPNGSTAMTILSGGNVGIGTASPGHKLEVAGAIHATGEITGATVNATFQDVAEWVPSTQELAAGTVVVLDAARTNHVVASAGAYDTAVAGVISAQPGLLLGVAGEGKVKVATTGRVKVRVDATRGAIRVGDLLVTSGREGVAMKSVPVDLGGTPIHRPGTIIGKALEPLERGVGEILVLLSLQ